MQQCGVAAAPSSARKDILKRHTAAAPAQRRVTDQHTRVTVTAAAVAGTEGLPQYTQDIFAALLAAHPGLAAGAAANTAVFTLGFGVLRKGLTLAGIAHSWFLGTSVFAAFGWAGYLLVCLYFICGTLVTKLKLAQKQAEGIAEARSGLRGPGSVWGSGTAAIICAWAAILSGQPDVWQVGFVASICSKLSDTVSSEVGKAYGKTTYLVTTFELVPRGTEGAVSVEGTAGGIAAATVFSVLALALGQVDIAGAGIVAAAAVAANMFESYIGASAQGQLDWLSNDAVNIIQICLAAALAVAAKAALPT